MRGPAGRAAAEPETMDPEAPVHAVGIGPGNPAYLTARARRTFAGADVVLGFETVLEHLRVETDADRLACSYEDQEATLEAFAGRVAGGDAGAAAFMGDPSVSGYAFLGRIESALDRPVRVIPGVSSVQVAAGRARTPIEESTVVTLHKRGDIDADLDRLVRDAGDRHLIVLPRPYDWMPGDVAAHLIDRGTDGTLEALVFERLTLPDESRTRLSLAELAARGEDNILLRPLGTRREEAMRRLRPSA